MERKQRVSVRLSDAEYETISKNAENAGYGSASEYIRDIAVAGVKTVFYDPEVDAEIRGVHEEARRLAEYVNDLVKRSEAGNLANTLACRTAEAQIRRLNYKLRFIQDSIAEYKEAMTDGDNETPSD